MPIDHVNYPERRKISVTLTEYEAGLLRDLVTDAFRASKNHSAKVAFDHILSDLNSGEQIAESVAPAKPTVKMGYSWGHYG